MSEKKKKKRKAADFRDKIDVLALIEALERHVLGKNKMSATQVSAALALLKKTLPDLAGTSGRPVQEHDVPRAHEDALKELE